MKLVNTFVLLTGIFLFGSCAVSSDDIRIDSVEGVEISGVTLSQARLIVKMTLANDSRARLTVRGANLSVSDARGKIAEVFLDEELVLKRKSSTEIVLPLTVRFSGAMGSVTALPRLSADPESLLLDGTICLKGGSIRKNLSVANLTLNDFLDQIGASELELF